MESEVEVGKYSMQYNIYGGLNPPRCYSMEGLVTFGSSDKNGFKNSRTGSKSVYKTNTACLLEVLIARTFPPSH